MNKGFTLIEMIAVVIIISLIALVTVPVITNKLVDKKEEVSKTTVSMIETATDLYLNDRITEYPKVVGNKYCVTLETLTNNGYLKKPLKDLTSGGDIPLDKYVIVNINSYGDFEYTGVLADEC